MFFKHHHYLHFLKNRELNELYLSMAIRSFAISLIGVFVPIYLLKSGYSLKLVLFFYLLVSIFHASFSFPAAKLASRWGFKHLILISLPLLVLFYFLLYNLDAHHWNLSLMAAVLGISQALFWVGYHVDFAKFSDFKNRAKEQGAAQIISTVFSILGPLGGGIILSFWGFKVLLLLVAVLLVSSAIPLFFSKELHQPLNCSLRQIFKHQKPKDILANIGHGMEAGAAIVLWPLFIYLFIMKGYTSIGAVVSLSFVLAIVFNVVISHFSDTKRASVLKSGAFSNALVWVGKTLVQTNWHVFLVDSFYGMTKTATQIPFIARCYDKANKTNIAEYIVFKEVTHHLGRVILFLLMIALGNFVVSFLMGSFGSLLQIFY